MGKDKKILITLYISESCLSLGDALREIYAKGSIKSDFVLINGLVISNMCLKPILEMHKKRRQKEKVDTLMTLIFLGMDGRVPFDIRQRYVVAMDVQSNRILYFSGLRSSRIQIPMEAIDKAKNFKVQCDIWHSDVSICSPQVPQFFADNFDYQSIPDFANDILVNEEILGSQIHVHIEPKAYSFTLSNFPLYYRLSLDVLNKWFYPTTPEKWRLSINLTDTYLYEQRLHNIYLPKDSSQFSIAQNSVLQRDVLIGCGTDIGSDSNITRSIIGNKCKIGCNTIVKDSILWDSVVVGDHCVVNNSVLAKGVILHDGVHLKNGSCVNQNIQIGPYQQFPGPTVFHDSYDELKDLCLSLKRKNRPLPADSILSLAENKDGQGYYVKLRFPGYQPKSQTNPNEPTVGVLDVATSSTFKPFGPEPLLHKPVGQFATPHAHSNALDHQQKLRPKSEAPSSLTSHDESDSTTDSADLRGEYLSDGSSSTDTSACDINDDDVTSGKSGSVKLSPNPARNNKIEVESPKRDANLTRRDRTISVEDANIPEDLKAFYSELYESFQRCEEDGIPLKNLILEINSSKHAYNINLQDLWFCLGKIIFALKDARDQDKNAVFNYYKKRLSYYTELISNYFKSQESQTIFLVTYVELMDLDDVPSLQANFAKILHHMYNEDTIAEDAIVRWFESSVKESLPTNLIVQAEAFVKWLEEAEEDSDDED